MKCFIIKSLSIVIILFLFSCTMPFEQQESDLSVITLNLLAGNDEGSVITDKVLALDPHVIVAVELTEQNLDYGKLIDAGYYPNVYEPSNSSVKGIGIFSKYEGSGEVIPVLTWSASSYSIDTMERMPMARFAIESLGVNILAVHIPPPLYFSKEEREEVTDLVINEIDQKTIVAGDFNMFATDPLFHKILDKGLSDSAKESENYGVTWNGFARIDYILIPDRFTPLYSGTLKIPGSDHYAVISGFNILE